MMDHLFWFLLLTFLAEIIGTIGGFGSSVFFVPLAGLFFGFEEVLGVTAVFHVASNFAKIVLFRKGLDKFVLINIGVPAVLFVLLGSYLSGILVTKYFELFLGVFLVLFSGFLLIKENLVIEPNARNAWIGGAFSGFAAGLLGTGGAILNAIPYCNTDDIFIVNGDTYFDVNLDDMLAYQQQKMADCTLALKPMNNADRYGLVRTNDQSMILSFEEKQAGASGLINGGVYCLFKHSFLNIPFDQTFSFEKDYLEKFINERDMAGYVHDGYFIDIGIPEDYERAIRELPGL